MSKFQPYKAIPSMCIPLLVLSIATSGCFNKMSEQIEDSNTGMNGSFEVEENGYPVNWLLYAPTTVPDSDFDLLLDTSTAKDGNQSLRFTVRTCQDIGGWRSPGLATEVPATSPGRYQLTFWIKNHGSRIAATIGGVSAFEGDMESVIESNASYDDWMMVSHEYTISPPFEKIRFEFNILEPGTVLIDDVRIEKREDADIG